MSDEIQQAIDEDAAERKVPTIGAKLVGYKPVPPVGAEVEVLGYQVTRLEPTGVARLDRPMLSKVSDWGPAFTVIELVDRAHVTRLQAEVARLKREEKNDKIAYDAVLQRQNEIRAERDALKAEVEEWKGAHKRAMGINADVHVELTKARESLSIIKRSLEEANESGVVIDTIWTTGPCSETLFDFVDRAMDAHQSAPAAKGGPQC